MESTINKTINFFIFSSQKNVSNTSYKHVKYWITTLWSASSPASTLGTASNKSDYIGLWQVIQGKSCCFVEKYGASQPNGKCLMFNDEWGDFSPLGLFQFVYHFFYVEHLVVFAVEFVELVVFDEA